VPYAALERMLQPERFRQRAASRGGFSTPGLCFASVSEDSLPLLASNMRGSFRLTRRNAEGLAPFGFSAAPVGQEDDLLNELFRVLEETSAREGWSNRCSGVPEALDRMQSLGLEPKSVVVSESLVAEMLGPGFDLEGARRTMATQGFLTAINGMQVLLSNLPKGSALVTGPPSMVGVYTRVGDHVGLLLQRVNRSVMVVRSCVAQ
jgi:hypothetical protein